MKKRYHQHPFYPVPLPGNKILYQKVLNWSCEFLAKSWRIPFCNIKDSIDKGYITWVGNFISAPVLFKKFFYWEAKKAGRIPYYNYLLISPLMFYMLYLSVLPLFLQRYPNVPLFPYWLNLLFY